MAKQATEWENSLFQIKGRITGFSLYDELDNRPSLQRLGKFDESRTDKALHYAEDDWASGNGGFRLPDSRDRHRGLRYETDKTLIEFLVRQQILLRTKPITPQHKPYRTTFELPFSLPCEYAQVHSAWKRPVKEGKVIDDWSSLRLLPYVKLLEVE